MSESEPLLTESEAAKFLNISSGTLRNWRCKGKGPAWIALGSAIRYAPGALRKYIEISTRGAG